MSFPKNLSSLVLIALACLSLLGCGESGSSGFDATGSGGTSVLFQEEQTAIETVTENGGCQTLDDVVICSQDTTSDTSNDTRTTRGSGKPSIFMNPISESLTDCTNGPLPGECELSVSIIPSNFPSGTQFFPVVRILDSISPWLMDSISLVPSPGIPLLLEGTVRVVGLSGSGGEQIQLAVLAYLSETPVPGPSYDNILLGELDPDYAFVATHISLLIQ